VLFRLSKNNNLTFFLLAKNFTIFFKKNFLPDPILIMPKNLFFHKKYIALQMSFVDKKSL
jgi:hypothetical protein